MTHEFRNNRSQLVILADAQDRADLRELKDEDPDKWGTSQAEIEQLEHMLCNCELGWINPEDTGDLTDAPILGIVAGSDDEIITENKGPHGAIVVGSWDGAMRYAPILERWAYMLYERRTFLEDLLDKGEAVFVDSNQPTHQCSYLLSI